MTIESDRRTEISRVIDQLEQMREDIRRHAHESMSAIGAMVDQLSQREARRIEQEESRETAMGH